MSLIQDIQSLLDEYTLWLKDKTVIGQIDDNWVKITTPHLDRHNDCIEFYARQQGNGYLLSDDGYIVNDLRSSGCELDTPKRQELMHLTLSGFGIQLENDALLTTANKSNFALKKHNFIQAMLAVNDLFYLAAPHVSSLFYEDVARWLDLSEIRYTPKVKFVGHSGFDHMFDFVIPKSSQEPERILQAVNYPKKDSAEALVFKWLDTREIRSPNSSLYAILNDKDRTVSGAVLDALESYDLKPILWSERQASVQILQN